MQQPTWSQDDVYQLFELSDELIGIANTAGFLVYVNSAWEQVFSCSRQELYAKPYLDFIHSDDRPAMREAISSLSKHNQINLATRFLDQNITWKITQNDALDKIYLVVKPQTSLQEIQEELQEKRTVMASLNELILVFNRAGIFTNIYQPTNKPEIYLPPNAFVGQHFRDAFPLSIAEKLQEALDTLYKTQMVQGFNYTLSQENQDVHYHAKLSLKHSADGKISGATALIRNITGRKSIENALAHSEKLYRAVVSHLPKMAVIIFDQDFRYVLADGEALSDAGFSKEFLEGKTVWETFSAEAVSTLTDEYTRVFQGESFYSERHYNNRVYDIHALPITDANETIVQGLLVLHDVTQIRQSEEHLRRVLNGLFTFVGILDVDGKLLEANETVLAISSFKIEDILHRPLTEIFWWSYSTEVQERLQSAIHRAQEGEAVRYDELVQIAPDQYMNIDFAIVPIFDAAGNITHLVPSAVDISERVQNHQALEESLLWLNSLYKMTHTIMGVLDREVLLKSIVHAVDNALKVNRIALYLVDSDKKETIGFAKAGVGEQHIYPASYDELLKGLSGWVLRENKPILSSKQKPDPREKPDIQRKRIVNQGGSIIVAPIRIRNKPIGTLTAINLPDEPDFTDKELTLLDALANQASIALEKLELTNLLKTNEQQYRQLVDTANDMVYQLDRDGFITFANPIMLKILNYTEDELMGMSAWEVIHPDCVAEVQAHYRDQIKNQIDNTYHEYPLVRKDGTTVWAGHNVQLILHEKLFVGTRGFSRDISQRKEVETEREQLIEDLNAFGHTVAHDLKTPITALVGYGELLTDTNNQPSDITYYAQQIIRASYAMKQIIDELLRFAEIRHRDDVELVEFKMEYVVRQALERLEIKIQEYQAEIIMPATWYSVKSYAPWIEEIWANYISNAIKYGNRPPKVELGNDILPDQRIRFWVKDNGQGLTPDEQEQLFVKFSRLNNPNAVEGHGLGLSIVKRIAEKLGAELEVESQPHQGSRFSFILPNHTVSN